MTRVAWRIAGVVTALAGTVVLGQPQLRPGQYAITDEVTIAGKMDRSTHSACVDGDLNNLPKMLLNQVEGNNCKVSNLVTSGNRMTFQMTCAEEEVNAACDLTFAGDSYTGTIRMTMSDAVIAVKTSARRTGPCSR